MMSEQEELQLRAMEIIEKARLQFAVPASIVIDASGGLQSQKTPDVPA